MSDNIAHRSVSDFMTAPCIACSPYVSLAEAHELLKKNHIRRLPVVEQENRILGVITQHDVLSARPAEAAHARTPEDLVRVLSSITVGVVMTKKPLCVYQTDTVGRAAEIMLDNKIGGLPVIDVNDMLVGVVTESDIFRAIARQWRDDNLRFSGAHRS